MHNLTKQLLEDLKEHLKRSYGAEEVGKDVLPEADPFTSIVFIVLDNDNSEALLQVVTTKQEHDKVIYSSTIDQRLLKLKLPKHAISGLQADSWVTQKLSEIGSAWHASRW